MSKYRGVEIYPTTSCIGQVWYHQPSDDCNFSHPRAYTAYLVPGHDDAIWYSNNGGSSFVFMDRSELHKTPKLAVLHGIRKARAENRSQELINSMEDLLWSLD